MLTGRLQSNANPTFLMPCFLEFLAFQIYQIAPMEFEEWFSLIQQQCKDPNNPMPELNEAREALALTLELVTHSHP